MRIRQVGKFGSVLPVTAHIIMNHLREYCTKNGLRTSKFTVDQFPLSVNHQFLYGKFKLDPRVEDFRTLVKASMGPDRFKWNPKGITAAILFFESPEWLTKDLNVRTKDVDNLIKPTIDAAKKATKTPDENHWELHVYKIQSITERLTVFLYDLGDEVELYS